MPKRAIERIACAAGRQKVLCVGERPTRRDPHALRVQRRRHMVRRLVEIIDPARFTQAALFAILRLDDDHVGLGEGVAGNPERRLERIGLQAHFER